MKLCLRGMELRHLRYFVAVAEEENVTRASAKLRVSQPAVSRQVRDLEDELGVPLFQRSAKSVRLTEAGHVFLAEAKAVLKRAAEAVAAARAIAGGTAGKLDVGYAPSLTVEILPRALRAFQAVAPGVRVVLHDLTTEEMMLGLRDGRLDLALMVRPEGRQPGDLRFHELARYPMCLAVAPGHPLAQLAAVKLKRLAAQPLIAYSRTGYPEYHESLSGLFSSLASGPSVSEEHDSVTSLIAAVEAGRGVAVVPRSLACLAGERLKLIPLQPSPEPLVVGAVCRRAPASPRVAQFIAAAASEPAKPLGALR